MAAKVMLIRHAEKPTGASPPAGVGENGIQDPEDLTVRGWQRAGALIRFFAPASAVFADSRLARPDKIFASGTSRHSKSLRPQSTVIPLAQFLGKTPDLNHTKGDEEKLARVLLKTGGVVLVSWVHEGIPAIANQILGNDRTCPQAWPDDRFDLVWLFEASADETWNFVQIPQMLLPGDRTDPI